MLGKLLGLCPILLVVTVLCNSAIGMSDKAYIGPDGTYYGEVHVLKELGEVDKGYLKNVIKTTTSPNARTSYDIDNLVAVLNNLADDDLVIEFWPREQDEKGQYNNTYKDMKNPDNRSYAMIRMVNGEPKILAFFTGANIRSLNIPRFFFHYIHERFQTKDITLLSVDFIKSQWHESFLNGIIKTATTPLTEDERAKLSPLLAYTNSLICGLNFRSETMDMSSEMKRRPIFAAPPVPLLLPQEYGLQRIAVITIGIPGCGKSTVINKLKEYFLNGFEVIDIDNFVEKYLPKDDQKRTEEQREQSVKEAYQKAWADVEYQRDQEIKASHNIVYATTLQNLKSLDFIKEAAERLRGNYRVIYVSVNTDPELARERAQQRAITSDRAPISDAYMRQCEINTRLNLFLVQGGAAGEGRVINLENLDKPRIRSFANFLGDPTKATLEAKAWKKLYGEESIWTLDQERRPMTLEEFDPRTKQSMALSQPERMMMLSFRAGINALIHGFKPEVDLNKAFQSIPPTININGQQLIEDILQASGEKLSTLLTFLANITDHKSANKR